MDYQQSLAVGLMDDKRILWEGTKVKIVESYDHKE